MSTLDLIYIRFLIYIQISAIFVLTSNFFISLEHSVKDSVQNTNVTCILYKADKCEPVYFEMCILCYANVTEILFVDAQQ